MMSTSLRPLRWPNLTVPLADVLAGVEAGAALADDDRAGVDGGAVVHLHAEPLGLRVAPVLGRTGALGLGHVVTYPFEMPVISMVE
jgi:hypothetical protein